MYKLTYKNDVQYKNLLSILIEDIERIMLYISYNNVNENLLMKLKMLKQSFLNKKENKIADYENDYIVISNDYVMVNYLGIQKTIEINQGTDIIIGTEHIVLIKRNMRDFYFFNRKILYEINEGSFISRKLESIWNKEHFEVKNKSILYEESNLNINELLEEKIYMKGSK